MLLAPASAVGAAERRDLPPGLIGVIAMPRGEVSLAGADAARIELKPSRPVAATSAATRCTQLISSRFIRSHRLLRLMPSASAVTPIWKSWRCSAWRMNSFSCRRRSQLTDLPRTE